MATYLELAEIKNGTGWNDFLSQVNVALQIKAASIIDEPTSVDSLTAWAKAAITNPVDTGRAIANYVVAANASATLLQIYGASEATIQTNVNTEIDALYGV